MKAVTALHSALIVLTGQTPGPDPVDLLRIAEAYRLTEVIQDSVWPGGWGPIPFPVLLVTEEQEYLIADPRTPDGFEEVRLPTHLETRILKRPRQFEPYLLATFPAFGPPPVIVVGRPEATGKTSSSWVLTLVHEHFHQFQMSDPGYHPAVEELDLSDGDQTGMWMLDYPFPYDAQPIAHGFSELSRDLARMVDGSSAPERRAFWDRYARFLEGLPDRDRRYLGFQVWQEGIARYVELRAAEVAALVFDPSPGFRAISDFQPLAGVAAQLRADIRDELAHPDLAGRQRVAFYAFGAGLALLLDEDVPDWKARYQTERFAVERYLPWSR